MACAYLAQCKFRHLHRIGDSTAITSSTLRMVHCAWFRESRLSGSARQCHTSPPLSSPPATSTAPTGTAAHGGPPSLSQYGDTQNGAAKSGTRIVFHVRSNLGVILDNVNSRKCSLSNRPFCVKRFQTIPPHVLCRSRASFFSSNRHSPSIRGFEDERNNLWAALPSYRQ